MLPNTLRDLMVELRSYHRPDLWIDGIMFRKSLIDRAQRGDQAVMQEVIAEAKKRHRHSGRQK